MMSEQSATPTLADATEAVRARRLDEAETLLAAVLMETPNDAAAHSLGFSIAMQQRRFLLARTRAEAALALTPDDAGALSNLGAALVQLGNLSAAKVKFDDAIDRSPNHFYARRNRGLLSAINGQFAEAANDLKIAVRTEPKSGDARMALADALTETGQFEEAASVIREAAKLEIGSQIERTYVWGRLMFRMGRFGEARQAFAAALSANPDEMKHYRALSAASFHCGDTLHAEQVTLGAIKKYPGFTRGPADPELHVLVLEALGADQFTDPGRGPLSYMQGNFVAFLPPEQIAFTHVLADRIESLTDTVDLNQFDIVLNNRPVHERIVVRAHEDRVKKMAAEISVPIVNSPAAVAQTTREANAARFAAAENFIFPRTFRHEHELDIAVTRERILAALDYPFILRPLHTNFGHGVKLIENDEALSEFLQLHPFSEFYAIEYHDCLSSDGLFRRYRVACIGGKLVAEGLRANDSWNVHNWPHAPEKWFDRGLDKEEEAFWANPEAVLGASPETFFREIIESTPLDIYGIDFAFRPDGRAVVFEVNAAMAIALGGDLNTYPYRREHCHNIKKLIATLLFETAGKKPPSVSSASEG